MPARRRRNRHYAPERQGDRGSGVSAGHYTSSTRYSRGVSSSSSSSSSGDWTLLPGRGTAGPSTHLRPHYGPNLWNILEIIRRSEGGASSRLLSPSSARGGDDQGSRLQDIRLWTRTPGHQDGYLHPLSTGHHKTRQGYHDQSMPRWLQLSSTYHQQGPRCSSYSRTTIRYIAAWLGGADDHSVKGQATVCILSISGPQAPA
jgi:hypothetical protein